MSKTKVVKAKVTKIKKNQQTTKKVDFPYEVWDINSEGFFAMEVEFKTKAEARREIKECSYSDYRCPVIVHIDIPPMKY